MRKFLTYIFVLLLAMSAGKVMGQTVAIPDPNFRQALASHYSYVLDGNQELIIANADTITGAFYCGESNIVNLDGIQYFKNISTLRCFKNKLTTLPDLTNLTKLISIECYHNQISSLPSLSSLTDLRILDAGGNQLSSFPTINGLTNLTEIIIYGNQLTSIPDLSHLVNLTKLHCYENKITTIGKMPASLKDLNFGTNQLVQIPDISLATGLIYLGAYTNRITSLPELTSHTSLIHLNLGTNKLESVPEYISSMTELTYLTLDNNLFHTLPDLSGLTQLTYCDIRNNFFTFEDLLPSSTNPTFTSWMISPQDSVDVLRTYRGTEHKSIRFTLNLDEHVSGLTFSWYHNGSLRTQTSEPILEIYPLKKEDAGIYYCSVTSSDPVFASLNLLSKTFTLGVLQNLLFEKELTLTPDGDGRNDELFFEENGQLKVFDSSGNLIDQQSAPCIWNGTTKSGKELGTGFYILRINDNTTYGVTMIR